MWMLDTEQKTLVEFESELALEDAMSDGEPSKYAVSLISSHGITTVGLLGALNILVLGMDCDLKTLAVCMSAAVRALENSESSET